MSDELLVISDELLVMKKIDLVFRTVNERTSDIALRLAKKHIVPDNVYVINNVKPFTEAVKQMLQIKHKADYVVYVDADCLIMENMRPFIENTNLPFIDCYVLDKFRGRVHAGVHITRIDVVREMKKVVISKGDQRYVLRPESRTRNFALRNLNLWKTFKDFRIFHDHCQYHHDIFVKYALRELRSRNMAQRKKIEASMKCWNKNDDDFKVAKFAIEYTKKNIEINSPAFKLHEYIVNTPSIAQEEISKLGLTKKKPLTFAEVKEIDKSLFANRFDMEKTEKIFGIGLSRTGTKSLTQAVSILGYNVVHYPVEQNVFDELTKGTYDFSLLEDLDGITDITVAPFYAQLDKLYPDSKFILTIRDKNDWLNGLEKHWKNRAAFDDTQGRELHMKIRRFLRSAVYGTYTFNWNRMSFVYDQHLQNAKSYFRNRPNKLLIIDITKGEGWEKLCYFMNKPIPDIPFPQIKRKGELVDTALKHPAMINDEM